MRIAVCVKPIPSADTPAALDPSSLTLVRSGGLVIDEADTYSVEVALQLVESVGDGEVVLVAMASEDGTAALRSGLALGATRAVLVADAVLAGSDALTTARVLAMAIRTVAPDLVLTATESSDGYAGTVAAQLAELLDLPGVTFARSIAMTGSTLAIERQTDLGYDEIECDLPALVSVTAGVVEPRYPSFKSILAAKSKPIDVLSIGDLGLRFDDVGAAQRGQTVVAIQPEPRKPQGERVVDNDGSSVAVLIERLQSWGRI